MRIVTDFKHAQQIIVELDAEVERLQARVDKLEAALPVAHITGLIAARQRPTSKGK